MSGWGSSCGGSGCDVVAILSANKTDKINPVSHLHEQGWSCVVVKTSNDQDNCQQSKSKSSLGSSSAEPLRVQVLDLYCLKRFEKVK